MSPEIFLSVASRRAGEADVAPAKGEKMQSAKTSLEPRDVSGRLAVRKNLRMRGPCFGGGGGDVDGGIERKRGWWQAKFCAAGLVAQFQGNMLLPRRSRRERVHGQAKNHRALVHVEGLFGKRERFELSLGIHHFAAPESRRQLGFEVRRDQIIFR